ncbi:MAG: hypothetical protein HYS53_03050 [Candidatus Aenigmarchaeota archaeon]|nr:hypothetical protein [Candidatus Aenigmarchaeota archaeon]
MANDTTDLWNTSGYFLFSISFSPPTNPPPSGGGGGGGDGSGGFPTTTTTTTTTTTAITATTVAVIKVEPVTPAVNTEWPSSEIYDNTQTNVTTSETVSNLMTGAVFVGRNPFMATVSLVILGIISANYLSRNNRLFKASKRLLKKFIKRITYLFNRLLVTDA